MNIFPETLGLCQIISRELKEEIERRYNTYVELEQRLAEARVEDEHLRQQSEWLRLSAKALTIQPDDSALMAWLGEPIAWRCNGELYEVLQRHLKDDSVIAGQKPLYSPKKLK